MFSAGPTGYYLFGFMGIICGAALRQLPPLVYYLRQREKGEMTMSGLDQTPPRKDTVRSKSAPVVGTRGGLDIAVIIVTYKPEKLTVECLCSVEAERFAAGALRIRAIVVDNASGDLPAIAEAVERNHWSSWVTLVATTQY